MNKLFKYIVTIAIFFWFLTPVSIHAEGTTVEAKILGEISKGNVIEIQIDLKNVRNMYAASLDFCYDASSLSMKSINANQEITGKDIYEYNYPNYQSGIARYGFTSLGATTCGYTGSGNFLTIQAQILKEGQLNINPENFKIDLVEKVNDSMVDINFQLIIDKTALSLPDDYSSNEHTLQEDENTINHNASEKVKNITLGNDKKSNSDSDIEVNGNSEIEIDKIQNSPSTKSIIEDNIQSKNPTMSSETSSSSAMNSDIANDNRTGEEASNINNSKGTEFIDSNINQSIDDSDNIKHSNNIFSPIIILSFIILFSLYAHKILKKKKS